MSHEITACRRKWQLMKSPRSRSHRQKELGSEILNTKSHFWFGSWWNSEPKLGNVWVRVWKRDSLWQDRWGAAVCGLVDRTGTPKRRAQGLGRRSVMMMSRCSAAAKMDWPKLDLIKSQGWRCSSADIINIKMIIAEQFGSAEANQFTAAVWFWISHICILTTLTGNHVHVHLDRHGITRI